MIIVPDKSPKTLIATVGLPYSGKSTWARAQRLPMVSPDAVRLALHGQRYEPCAEEMVWATTFVMLRALFKAGHNVVIFDATNVSRKRRDRLRQAMKEFEMGVLCFKLFEENATECTARALALGDAAIVAVIERMDDEFEGLSVDERLYGGPEIEVQ